MLDQLSQLFRPVGSFWQTNRYSSKALSLAVVIVTLMLLLIFKFNQPQPPVKLQEEKAWLVQTQQLVAGAKSPQLELYGRVESPYTATITSSITADIKPQYLRPSFPSNGARIWCSTFTGSNFQVCDIRSQGL